MVCSKFSTRPWPLLARPQSARPTRPRAHDCRRFRLPTLEPLLRRTAGRCTSSPSATRPGRRRHAVPARLPGRRSLSVPAAVRQVWPPRQGPRRRHAVRAAPSRRPPLPFRPGRRAKVRTPSAPGRPAGRRARSVPAAAPRSAPLPRRPRRAVPPAVSFPRHPSSPTPLPREPWPPAFAIPPGR